jgi:MerR family transcriptional regulator/heat shock protein HspR
MRSAAGKHHDAAHNRETKKGSRWIHDFGRRGTVQVASANVAAVLRLYERVGLLKPSRSDGNTRLYTDSDLERLEVILTLTREMGVNLAGIEIILNMREKMAEMQHQMEAFTSFVQQELSRGLRSATARPPDNALVRVPPPKVIRVQKGDLSTDKHR